MTLSRVIHSLLAFDDKCENVRDDTGKLHRRGLSVTRLANLNNYQFWKGSSDLESPSILPVSLSDIHNPPNQLPILILSESRIGALCYLISACSEATHVLLHYSAISGQVWSRGEEATKLCDRIGKNAHHSLLCQTFGPRGLFSAALRGDRNFQ